jgi:hypothetical protein
MRAASADTAALSGERLMTPFEIMMSAEGERVLPRWLGIFAAATVVALAVNAGFVYASFVPALLLFLLWTLVTSIVLLRRSTSTQPLGLLIRS